MAYGDEADAGWLEDVHCIHKRRPHDAKDISDSVGYKGFDKGFAGGHLCHRIILFGCRGMMLAGVAGKPVLLK